MALIEINLEEPALLESQTRTKKSTKDKSSKSSESGGSARGKVLGLLVLVAGVSLLAWKLRGGSDEEVEEFGVEDGFEETESSGAKGKIFGALGLLVALVGVGAARKRGE